MAAITGRTSKKDARARLMRDRAVAAAARADRERANITDLTEFVVQVGNLEEVGEWLAARIAKAQQDAEERRRRFEVAAGRALLALRSRGETVGSIAEQASITQAKVREFLKLADDAAAAEQQREATETPKSAKTTGHRQKATPGPESPAELQQEPAGEVVDATESAAADSVSVQA
ncbi:MAG TPA: hypothetical protein VLZ05_06190 [Mycobacterium sp.]|nr:hypothetical protein [Mycobacterium sp.]HUH68495.1 hypothetical protein [Mycobacterium sp.]